MSWSRKVIEAAEGIDATGGVGTNQNKLLRSFRPIRQS